MLLPEQALEYAEVGCGRRGERREATKGGAPSRRLDPFYPAEIAVGTVETLKQIGRSLRAGAELFASEDSERTAPCEAQRRPILLREQQGGSALRGKVE